MAFLPKARKSAKIDFWHVWAPERPQMCSKHFFDALIVLFRQFWPRTCLFTKKWDSTPNRPFWPTFAGLSPGFRLKCRKVKIFGYEKIFWSGTFLGQNGLIKTLAILKKCFVQRKCLKWPQIAKKSILADFLKNGKMAIFRVQKNAIWGHLRHFRWTKHFLSIASVLISPFWPRKVPLQNIFSKQKFRLFEKFWLFVFWFPNKGFFSTFFSFHPEVQKKFRKMASEQKVEKWMFSRPKWAD